MTAPSERHGPARPPSPDVEVAADTTVFAASAERAVTEGHGHASRCAPGPSLQERLALTPPLARPVAKLRSVCSVPRLSVYAFSCSHSAKTRADGSSRRARHP